MNLKYITCSNDEEYNELSLFAKCVFGGHAEQYAPTPIEMRNNWDGPKDEFKLKLYIMPQIEGIFRNSGFVLQEESNE